MFELASIENSFLGANFLSLIQIGLVMLLFALGIYEAYYLAKISKRRNF